MTGEVYSSATEVAYRLEGKWSEEVTLTNVKTGESEVIWRKKPYPENW